MLNVHRNLRDEEKGVEGVWRWEKREITYLSLHCHHQNDSGIKQGTGQLTDRDKQHPSPMPRTAPRGHCQTTLAIVLTDSTELAAKSEK